MVEFGLKLEDNKVSEWSEHYIDYEGLKKILKKAKNAEKKYRELYDKNPSDAEQIAQLYRSGGDYASPDVISPSVSGGDLASMLFPIGEKGEAPSSISLQTIHSERHGTVHENSGDDAGNGNDADNNSANTRATPTEETALLQNPANVTVTPPNDQQTGTKTYSSTRESIQRTLSNLSDHLSMFTPGGATKGNRYERLLRIALKEMDDQTASFDALFRAEQRKVGSFYYEKLRELEDRLEYVKESVAREFGILRSNNAEERGMDDLVMSLRGGKRVSPFPAHRKSASSLGQKMEGILQRLAYTNGSIGRSTASVGAKSDNRNGRVSLARLFAAENINLGGVNDDEDFEDNAEIDEKRLAEAESIRRSLLAQYRFAKLLHNYAIMNITGFVKIVKKFDKTIPSAAGRYNSALESRNMLNDGKAVDALATKYEQLYANWFCDGDLRAGKAQMLTKQGDGLEMDWSQLQLGYRMGMCAVLALWVCWDCVWGLVADGTSTIGARAAFPVFRACGGLLLLQWFWGCSVFVWSRYRVNYIYLFDLDPRNISTPLGIFAQAVDNTLIFMLLMLLYYKVCIFIVSVEGQMDCHHLTIANLFYY
jgi:hypothetical protein